MLFANSETRSHPIEQVAEAGAASASGIVAGL